MSNIPVHPRVGGERMWWWLVVDIVTGSSPRGRGTRARELARAWRLRFIPAWAGNAPNERPASRQRAVHPRVGGERVEVNNTTVATSGSSPRGRGTLPPPIKFKCNSRFIPAWAGNARHNRPRAGQDAVHPRVGGERNPTPPTPQRSSGSSPRGRGTRFMWSDGTSHSRFIPAWAGNAQAPPATPR